MIADIDIVKKYLGDYVKTVDETNPDHPIVTINRRDDWFDILPNIAEDSINSMTIRMDAGKQLTFRLKGPKDD